MNLRFKNNTKTNTAKKYGHLSIAHGSQLRGKSTHTTAFTTVNLTTPSP